VRCVERDYYKDCSLAILRLKFRHNIPPDFDFLVSFRFLDPSIVNFSLSFHLSFAFSPAKTSLLKITLDKREVDSHRLIFVETVAILSYESARESRSKIMMREEKREIVNSLCNHEERGIK